MAKMAESAGKSELGTPNSSFAVHVKAKHLPAVPAGRIIRLTTGRLMVVSGRPLLCHVSDDDGKTWKEHIVFSKESMIEAGPTGALLQTANGTLVLGYINLAEMVRTWNDELKDMPGAKTPAYAMRSLDNGNTWQDRQKLHDEWTGATRDIIQLQSGRVVFTSMKMRNNPGRHTVLTYCSDDDGKTWTASNVIDLGGNGHHDGVTEGTIVELKDGRLLQYIRTSWGQFWRALSEDGGLNWHPYGPSGIEASSAPAMLSRLASGRIVLLWNRPRPEGAAGYPLRGGDGVWSATPASNFREELSMSFSEDECETWSPPVVVACRPGSECSYPYVFEPAPGILWITAHRAGGVQLKLNEADFV